MEKYQKPQTVVEEFKTVAVMTISGGEDVTTPSTGGPNELPFEPIN